MMAAALALAVTTGTVAQGRRPDPQKMELVKELHNELRTFAQGKILPTLRQWKAKLDGSMSAEDLTALNTLRARAAKLRDAMMEHGRAMRQAWKSEDDAALRTHRDAMKGLMGELHAIMKELKPLAEKYRSTLEAIGAEARPVIQEWRTEGKAIVEKWAAEHRDELGDHPRHMMRHGMPMSHMFGGPKKKTVARFMLWNGDDLPEMPTPDRNGPPEHMMDDDMLNLD